jgi:RDD family
MMVLLIIVPRTERPDEGIILASWIDRFIAWLIDFIIISIGLAILFALISFPFWLLDATNFNRLYNSVEPLHYVITSSVFFIYWTLNTKQESQLVKDYCI